MCGELVTKENPMSPLEDIGFDRAAPFLGLAAPMKSHVSPSSLSVVVGAQSHTCDEIAWKYTHTHAHTRVRI